MGYLTNPSFHELNDASLDLTKVESVEAYTNGRTLWVNVNGVCLLRICQVEKPIECYNLNHQKENE